MEVKVVRRTGAAEDWVRYQMFSCRYGGLGRQGLVTTVRPYHTDFSHSFRQENTIYGVWATGITLFLEKYPPKTASRKALQQMIGGGTQKMWQNKSNPVTVLTAPGVSQSYENRNRGDSDDRALEHLVVPVPANFLDSLCVWLYSCLNRNCQQRRIQVEKSKHDLFCNLPAFPNLKACLPQSTWHHVHPRAEIHQRNRSYPIIYVHLGTIIPWLLIVVRKKFFRRHTPY